MKKNPSALQFMAAICEGFLISNILIVFVIFIIIRIEASYCQFSSCGSLLEIIKKIILAIVPLTIVLGYIQLRSMPATESKKRLIRAIITSILLILFYIFMNFLLFGESSGTPIMKQSSRIE